MSADLVRTLEGRPPILMTPETVAGIFILEDYRAGSHGYEGLRQALAMAPGEVTTEVKTSGLRGRGGAGFPAGVKWGFVPTRSERPVYLVCNADEGEPGTFKDRWLLRHTPHQLIEGILIAAWAIGSHRAFIYLRGEFRNEERRLQACLAEARASGLLGRDILGSGWDCEITPFRGAGAYICGEETALLNSLEGKRGYPRVRPPFPANVGLYGAPTVINNVETLCNLPAILRRGGAWYAGYGTRQSTGTRLFSISGRIARPGVYEVELGQPWSVLIEDLAGGPGRGRPLKAVYPGGTSTPLLTAAEVAGATMDFESCMGLKTFLGSGGTVVLDEGDDMVEVVLNVARFYAHESCGQCTPCREGCRWMVQILEGIAAGTGRESDIDLLADITRHISGHTICAFGDAAAGPVASAVRKFREEFEARLVGGPAAAAAGRTA